MTRVLNLLLIGCLLQGTHCWRFKAFMPETIEVLSGSCVTIPCSFDIENKYKKSLDDTCKAMWKRKSVETTLLDKAAEVVFDSAEKNTIKGELRGILKNKDCTTTLKNIAPGTSHVYFFRLECDNSLKYDFNELVEISFKADPPSPTLTMSTLEMKEGTSVSVTCSAPAPCLSHPPTLTWTLSLGDSQETLQENEDKTKVMTSVLTFNASHLHHGKNISCTATYKKQDGTESASSRDLILDISFAPKILFTSKCTKTAAQLNCSCETVGNPSPILHWFLDGLPVNHSRMFAISDELLNDTSVRSIITVNQPQEKDLSTLICSSSSSLGSVTQWFYVYRLGCQNTTASEECSNQQSAFIIVVGVLAAALVCALLFATRAQRTGSHSPTKSLRTSDTGTAVMSPGLTHEKENEGSIKPEEDVYANTSMTRKSDKLNTRLEHQQFPSKSSERKNEESSDVVYASVIWKKKKKDRERYGDMDPLGNSYLEEEGCMVGRRSCVSNALEMGSLYDNIVTGKDAGNAAFTEYAQVNF